MADLKDARLGGGCRATFLIGARNARSQISRAVWLSLPAVRRLVGVSSLSRASSSCLLRHLAIHVILKALKREHSLASCSERFHVALLHFRFRSRSHYLSDCSYWMHFQSDRLRSCCLSHRRQSRSAYSCMTEPRHGCKTPLFPYCC